MVAGQLDPGAGFTVDLAIKDMAYVRGLGETLRAPLRVAGACAQMKGVHTDTAIQYLLHLIHAHGGCSSTAPPFATVC
jgi:3-hydroxyisobutyrate dehydrogenase-like beta-hydroxyacid dehydrogenase